LPNIEGVLGVQIRSGAQNTINSGALYYTEHNKYSYSNYGSGGSLEGTITFDASRSNDTYGNSETVQPPAISVYFYVCVSKYAPIEQGPYFTPHIDSNGELTWTNNGGLVNPSPINLKGPKGDSAFTVAIGNVGTLQAGEEATVTNVGTASNQIWDIDIPQGLNGNNGIAIFDTILKDHILTYEESKGLALQGTYVYKDAVPGSRYGYPDLYEKCVEEYNEASQSIWEQPVLTSNGVLGGNTFAVSADGEASNAPAYNMFDNKNSTYWYGTTNGKGYVILYNPTPLNIVNLTITNSQWMEDSIATGEILVSNNGTDWAKILTFTGNTTSNATWVIDLNSNGGFYKYYKINILSLGSTAYPPAIVNLEITTGNLVRNPNGHVFYDIDDKDIADSIFESTGVAWFYGIDTANERIFLPRNNYFALKGVIDNIPVVGTDIAVGFKQIKDGNTMYGSMCTNSGQAMFYAGCYGQPVGTWRNGSHFDGGTGIGLTTDALKSGIIADTSDVLKIDDSKYLYICVGNTEVETVVTDVVDVTTTENDTTPLFTGMYFDFTPNNISWLKGGEQKQSGGVYTFCYNELVNELTLPKYNLKVINESDMIVGVDYSEFWKVNQDSMTFTTPTKISSRSYEDIAPVVGNGMATGYTNGTDNFGMFLGVNGNIIGSKNAYGQNVGDNCSKSSAATYDVRSAGITTDSTKSGIEAHLVENTKAQLYFKVANAVQNLELLDAGRVMEEAILRSSLVEAQVVIETYSNGTSWYRVWSDGWCEQGGRQYVSNAQVAVTFLKPFKDTNYYANCRSVSANTYATTASIEGLLPESMGIRSTSTATWAWQACGYILR
jgi:hypothetical protein